MLISFGSVVVCNSHNLILAGNEIQPGGEIAGGNDDDIDKNAQIEEVKEAIDKSLLFASDVCCRFRGTTTTLLKLHHCQDLILLHIQWMNVDEDGVVRMMMVDAKHRIREAGRQADIQAVEVNEMKGID